MISCKAAAELWPLIDVDWEFDYFYAHLVFLQHEKPCSGAIVRSLTIQVLFKFADNKKHACKTSIVKLAILAQLPINRKSPAQFEK